jgi:FKBP-type peptidyl-prolyl cis-trans isomerase
MKLRSLLTVCALSAGLPAFADVQDIKVNVPDKNAAAAPATPAAATTPAAAPAPKFTEEQLIEEFGWFMAKRVGLTELELSKPEIEALIRGVSAAAAGKESPNDLEKIGPAMDEFMQRKQSAYMGKLKQQGQSESLAFFAKLKENKNVVETPSGLRYEIVNPGQGPAPKPTETVTVHYTGALINGSVFDSSVQRGKPEDIQLDQVIPGWTEGLQKISKGGKIKLYIPAHLAYGDDGRPGIPPSSTLVFDVELIDIKPTAPAAKEPVVQPAAPTGK